MATPSLALRFVERIVLVSLLVAVAAAPATAPTSAQVAPVLQDPVIQDPATLALRGWQAHLRQIGWPEKLSDLWAPRLRGVLSKSVANEHGGTTLTFDGSKPGMLATVTLVLGPGGKPVADAVVQFADVLEAR